jgi:UDPglucose 6-dehydrogenase
MTSSLHSLVTVVGCGKLGLPLVAVLAESGHQVRAYDLNRSLIRSLDEGTVPWFEEGLHERLVLHRSRIEFVADIESAASGVSRFLVIVPTPSNENDQFSHEIVESTVMELVNFHLTSSDDQIEIVVISTVMPGTMRQLKKRIDEVSGSSSHKISLVYSPEFIALGNVISDMTRPELVLVGLESSDQVTNYPELVLSYSHTKPQICLLSWEEAEVSKIAVNTFVTTKISYANFVSELCDVTPNCHASNVLRAIGVDSRIGSRYLNPGTAYGGPCFPRDNKALVSYSKDVGVRALIAEATDATNEIQIHRLADFIVRNNSDDAQILLVGLAYKPRTGVTEDSASLKLERVLRLGHGKTVYFYDAYLPDNQELDIYRVTELQEIGNAPICAVLMVPDDRYKFIPDLLHPNSSIIDAWGEWSSYSKTWQNRYHMLGSSKSS